MLAAVPSCAGQCRFVRGVFVGAAGRGRGVVGILWGHPQAEVSHPAGPRPEGVITDYYPVHALRLRDHHQRHPRRRSCATRARYPVHQAGRAMTTDKTAITVRAAVDRFLASPRCRQPTTRRSYGGTLDRVAGQVGPGRPLREVAGDEVGPALTRLWAAAAPATWNQRRAAVASFLAWCARNGYPAPALPAGAERQTEHRDETRAVGRRGRAAADAPRYPAAGEDPVADAVRDRRPRLGGPCTQHRARGTGGPPRPCHRQGDCPPHRPCSWSGPGTPGRPGGTSAARPASGRATPNERVAVQVGSPHQLEPIAVPVFEGLDGRHGVAYADSGTSRYRLRTLWVREHLQHLGSHTHKIAAPAVRLAQQRRVPWWR